LACSERVHINVNDAAMEIHARTCLDDAGARGDIHFHHIPTNDAWCRDHGAIFVYQTMPDMSRRLVALDWGYNAWGSKYPPYDLDNQVAQHMAAALDIPCIEGGMILEGGSIDVNGAGVLLTTESCLFNPNRNPHMEQTQIEQRLRAMFGVEQICWLGEGIVGDDTDGHIDDITRFVAPDTIVTAVEDDPADENYAPLQENLERLRMLRDPQGMPFRIVTLPMPEPVVFQGERLPASYANFYIANRVVLLPWFGCRQDQQAQHTLQQLFPEREVVGIACRDILLGLGAFHCLTQQVPIALS